MTGKGEFMKDKFEGNRPEPVFIVPSILLRDQEFIKWVGSREFQVWAFLYSYIIRAPMKNEIGNFIYENFYKKGYLAASWNLQKMAKKLGKSENSASQISRLTTTLDKKGFLEKMYKPVNGEKTLIYVIGTHDKSINKYETLYAFSKFKLMDAEATLEKLGF